MRSPPRAERLAALLVAIALGATACSGGSGKPKGDGGAIPLAPCTASGPAATATPPSGPPAGAHPTTIAQLTSAATPLSILDTGGTVRPGPNVFSFDLLTGGGLVTGGSPQVWIARSKTERATGPFTATWYPFTAYEACKDGSPKSPLPGTYAVQISVPSAGQWFVAAVVENSGHRQVAVGDPGSKSPTGLTAINGPVHAQIGTKAISVQTPVATTISQAKQIDTRQPPSPLHYISLDQALTNGKPTVVAFATPLLCTSMLCGPVVDEVLLAYQRIGRDRANFIHVEEFLPGPTLTPPPATAENQSPGFKAWGFETEPWVVIIDKQGIIRDRFEGPVAAPQIEAALAPLL
jgi:hypothetical protein